MHLIILGPHGAGKGTQAKLISKQYGIERVSTGDIIREHIKKGSDWGKKVKQYIDKNVYVPDKLVDVVIGIKLKKHHDGFILDGYPRTLTQAEFLDKLMAQMGLELDVIFDLDVNKEELVKRMIKRGKEEGRSDDTEKGIRSRMNEYETKSEPVVEYYRKKGKLIDINGDQPVEKVFNNIKQVLDKFGMDERTLVIVKPDGVKKGLEKNIVKKYQDAGLRMIKRKELTPTSQLLKSHYSAHVAKPFYPYLEKFMSSSPIVAMVFEGPDAVAAARKVTGSTDPAKAEKGTIRRDFGDLTLPDEDRIMMNLVHASATREEAKKEIKLWFG